MGKRLYIKLSKVFKMSSSDGENSNNSLRDGQMELLLEFQVKRKPEKHVQ